MPTGGDKDDGDGASPLDGDGHDDRLVHPASADGEDISLPCLLRPSSSAVASMGVAMSQDLFKGLDSPLVPPAFAVDSPVLVTGGDEDGDQVLLQSSLQETVAKSMTLNEELNL